MRLAVLLTIVSVLGACATASNPATAPAQLAPSCSAKLARASTSFEITVIAPNGRAIPVTVYHPEAAGTYPVIAFSHGAFATPGRYRAMLEPLAAAGYVVIAPMHVDSEEFGRESPPSRDETWKTRNEDFSLALKVPQTVSDGLRQQGISIDASRRIAMGHSYGALIAQLAGGAMAIDPDGSRVSRLDPEVDAIVAWSPPGVVPTMMDAEGWNTIAVPSLTITGTTDILPGFIDDWSGHKASFDNAPVGGRALWVGEGINHYFGGVFGRVKSADENSINLFGRALAQTAGFIERNLAVPWPCDPGSLVEGESYESD